MALSPADRDKGLGYGDLAVPGCGTEHSANHQVVSLEAPGSIRFPTSVGSSECVTAVDLASPPGLKVLAYFGCLRSTVEQDLICPILFLSNEETVPRLAFPSTSLLRRVTYPVDHR